MLTPASQKENVFIGSITAAFWLQRQPRKYREEKWGGRGAQLMRLQHHHNLSLLDTNETEKITANKHHQKPLANVLQLQHSAKSSPRVVRLI